MIVRSFTIYQYCLPLIKKLIVHKKEITQRAGLIIHLTTDNGHEGWGEIAPLPGLHRETLKEALAQAIVLKSALVGQSIPPGIEHCNGIFENWLAEYSLASSVRFGIEMAILNLLAHTRHIALHKLISSETHDQIRISGLLDGKKEEVVQQTKKMIDDGYNSFKLKVSNRLEEEIDKVRALSAVIDGRALLHLDANQAWTLNQAVHFSNDVGLAAVEYIEEPFKNIFDIPKFCMKTTIPVALDESLQKYPFETIKFIEGVDIFVMKPMLLDGIEKSLQLAQHARRVGIETVISSSFESGIGILTLADLAGCTARDRWAGLDTLKWFKEDLLLEPLGIHRGKMNISQRTIHASDVDFSKLKKIESC